MNFIPLDRLDSGSPLGGGLLPSVSRTQQVLDQIQGRRPPASAASQARALEDTAGVALGAALSGAAAAQGFGDTMTAVVGACVALYGATQNHPMLTNVGRGMFAPYIASRVREAMQRPPAAAAAPAPTA